MKTIINTLVILLVLASCGNKKEVPPIKYLNWENRASEITDYDEFTKGKTYLPVYSHIYYFQEHRTFDLTITASIRNISATDTIYILQADYYNTSGENIRKYLKSPIYLRPMETVEIIIGEDDREGGSGANFVFEWAVQNANNPPLFEAVMISTYGQQGLSFSTRGVQIFE